MGRGVPGVISVTVFFKEAVTQEITLTPPYPTPLTVISPSVTVIFIPTVTLVREKLRG